MKVIDVYNKIANDEIKHGTRIKMFSTLFIYSNGYLKKDGYELDVAQLCISGYNLNAEAEIIEDNKDIEKIELYKDFTDNYNNESKLDANFSDIEYTITELLKEVNKLKKEVR